MNEAEATLSLGYGPEIGRCARCGDEILRDELHWEHPDKSGILYCDDCIGLVLGEEPVLGRLYGADIEGGRR
jgi:hypothetical protein